MEVKDDGSHRTLFGFAAVAIATLSCILGASLVFYGPATESKSQRKTKKRSVILVDAKTRKVFGTFMSVAAGTMLYTALAELLPEARNNLKMYFDDDTGIQSFYSHFVPAFVLVISFLTGIVINFCLEGIIHGVGGHSHHHREFIHNKTKQSKNNSEINGFSNQSNIANDEILIDDIILNADISIVVEPPEMFTEEMNSRQQRFEVDNIDGESKPSLFGVHSDSLYTDTYPNLPLYNACACHIDRSSEALMQEIDEPEDYSTFNSPVSDIIPRTGILNEKGKAIIENDKEGKLGFHFHKCNYHPDDANHSHESPIFSIEGIPEHCSLVSYLKMKSDSNNINETITDNLPSLYHHHHHLHNMHDTDMVVHEEMGYIINNNKDETLKSLEAKSRNNVIVVRCNKNIDFDKISNDSKIEYLPNDIEIICPIKSCNLPLCIPCNDSRCFVAQSKKKMVNQVLKDDSIDSTKIENEDDAESEDLSVYAISDDLDDSDGDDDSDDLDFISKNENIDIEANENTTLLNSRKSKHNMTKKIKAGQAELYKTGLSTALAIALHKFPEGFVIFTSSGYYPNRTIAATILIALCFHNVAEGLAISLPIYLATGNRMKSFLFACLMSSISPFLGAGFEVFISSLLTIYNRHKDGNKDEDNNPNKVVSPIVFGCIFGIISGMLVWIVIDGMLPSARRILSLNSVKNKNPKQHIISSTTPTTSSSTPPTEQIPPQMDLHHQSHDKPTETAKRIVTLGVLVGIAGMMFCDSILQSTGAES